MLAMHSNSGTLPRSSSCAQQGPPAQPVAPAPLVPQQQRRVRPHRPLAPALEPVAPSQLAGSASVVCFAHSAEHLPGPYRFGNNPSRASSPGSSASGYNGPSTWSTLGGGAGGKAAAPVAQATGGNSQAFGGSSSSNNNSEALISPELAGKTATVRFHLKYKTSFGQAVKLIGSHPKLGLWKLKDAVELRWSSGDQWVANVQLPAGSVYEYKYVLVDYETKAALEWQSGSNAVLAVVVSETDVSVYDNWGNNPGAMVQVDEDQMTRETKLQKWATEMMGYWKEARRLQIELVHKNNESQGLRNELAQLRMELSLERQSKQQAEQHVSELQVENASLKAQLVQKTVELNNTLAEVLQLLDKELEGEEYDDDDEGYMDDGEMEEQEEEDERDTQARLRFEQQQQGRPVYGSNGVSARRFGAPGPGGSGGYQAAGSARSAAMGSRG